MVYIHPPAVLPLGGVRFLKKTAIFNKKVHDLSCRTCLKTAFLIHYLARQRWSRQLYRAYRTYFWTDILLFEAVWPGCEVTLWRQ
jgi:hypothetical protein